VTKRQQGLADKRKAPPFGGAFLYSRFTFELAVHVGILAGFVVLTAARILLLLTGLLTTALLLAWLLTRVLVLLARFVLIAHLRDLPCLNVAGINGKPRSWLRWNTGSGGMIARQSRVGIVTPELSGNRLPKN
jgi:hypothetical protein